MARHLVAKGYSVSGYDPHEPARRAAAALGVALRESARDVAAASELVIIVVGFDHEVETVMYGPQGVMEAARSDLFDQRLPCCPHRIRQNLTSTSVCHAPNMGIVLKL